MQILGFNRRSSIMWRPWRAKSVPIFGCPTPPPSQYVHATACKRITPSASLASTGTRSTLVSTARGDDAPPKLANAPLRILVGNCDDDRTTNSSSYEEADDNRRCFVDFVFRRIGVFIGDYATAILVVNFSARRASLRLCSAFLGDASPDRRLLVENLLYAARRRSKGGLHAERRSFTRRVSQL